MNNTQTLRDATLKCTRCGFRSECYVQPTTKVGDVLNTGECDRCAYDEQDSGRTAVVVAIQS